MNVSKHGHCCAKNGPLGSSLFSRKLKEGRKEDLDQNDNKNNEKQPSWHQELKLNCLNNGRLSKSC